MISSTDKAMLVKKFYRSLLEFGYPLTIEYVSTTVDKILRGEDVSGGPAGFIKRWLNEIQESQR